MNFEYGAGVCLWADDAETRERWCSAVDFGDVGLPASLVAEGEALMAACNAGFTVNGQVVERHWTETEEAAFHGRAVAWTERVTAVLAAADITVAPYGATPEPEDDGPEFEGCVMACFTDVAARVAAERKELASFAWEETATWQGDTFKFRATERSPAEFLARLEREPGFVCGWWQASEGGTDAMLEGDPVEHAVACVRVRNATGLANFLSWLRVERVHFGEELAGLGWVPTKRHRLADAQGSWWEWFSFLRNATKAVQGGRPSAGYLQAEKERLFWRWTHGGWPADFGEALGRIGLRRESFNRWVK